RPRSTASASLAQTTRTRSPGLRPSSQRRRMQTCTLLPWSRGSSTSARGWRLRNACNSRCTGAGRSVRPAGSVIANAANAAESTRLRRIAVRTISRAAARVSGGVGVNDNVRVRATTDALHAIADRTGLGGGGPVAFACRQGQQCAGGVALGPAVLGPGQPAQGVDGFL